MLNNFIHSKTKSLFLEQLGTGNILDDAVAFIEDTKEIWNRGTFYNCAPLKTDGDGSKFLADDGEYKTVESKFIKFSSNKLLKFYCIEPVTITINGVNTEYPANSSVSVTIMDSDEWSITPTSDNSILLLESWPGTLGTFYSWLEGVQVFSGIVFDMNDLAMYEKWNQGHQGQYHVQFAQYKNCIFWSDNAYISDVSKRTNYTLYYSSELPLCYSSIPDNTFKSFYFAYNVTCDPNWSNPVYKESFAKATWATQVFSYYGLHSIGMFDTDSTDFNITLPKDCRGLMFYAPNILNAGVFDAINVTNFGAKSGSWRDAFGYCYQLSNLFIKNLKVNLNISWSPINQQSLEFILSNAANTNKITISLSPFTWHRLTDTNKTLASEKNITLELISTNAGDDNRLAMLTSEGDGTQFLANDGSYKEIIHSEPYLLTSETYKYSDLEAALDQGKQIIFQMTSDSQPYIVHELDRQSEGIALGCLVMTTDGIGATLIMCGSDDIMFEPYTQRVITLTGDGNSFLADDGTYKEINIDEKLEEAVALSIPHDMNEDFNSDFAI